MKQRYERLLEAVKADNVVELQWESGLAEARLDEIEAELGHPLPGTLRDLWQVMRPKEDIFGKHYASVWLTDAVPDTMCALPYGIVAQARFGAFWHHAWGAFPDSREAAERIVDRVSEGKPPLIWLGEQYYLPVIPDGQGGIVYDPPVLELDAYTHRFSVAYATLGEMYAIFWLRDPEGFLRGEGIELCTDAEVAEVPFWSDILASPEGVVQHPPYRHGVWYRITDFRSMGYMEWSLKGLHDAVLMDTVYRRGLQIRILQEEGGRRCRYDRGEDTFVIRLIDTWAVQPAIIELAFEGILEVPTLRQADGAMIRELYATDVRTVTLPERGDYICLSIDPTEGEDEVHGVRVPHTADGLRVMAKRMAWRAITPELYYADVRLCEAEAEDADRTVAEATARRWLAAFGPAEDEQGTMKKGLIAGNILWDALASSPTLLVGDEARAAFDALEYDRAMVFRGGECIGEVPGGEVDTVEISELGHIGKLCAEALESVDDVYVVAPDYAWCYVHTHEATALFVRKSR